MKPARRRRTDPRAAPVAAAVLLGACASTETRVLPPYELANGRMLQDVVTVAADPAGGAPVITSLTTYDVNATDRTVVVARESSSAPGAGLMLAAGLGSAAATSAAILGAAAILDDDDDGRDGDIVNASYSTSGNTATNGDAGDIDAVSGVLDGRSSISN